MHSFFHKLHSEPLCFPEDLGKPIPESLHAVSVCLPTWKDVIGYEEKDPRVINKLQLGYPRFVIHPLVAELNQYLAKQHLKPDELINFSCFAFPSLGACQRAKIFIELNSEYKIEICNSSPIALKMPKAAFNLAKQYAQHSGEVISSRQAEFLLQKLKAEEGIIFTPKEEADFAQTTKKIKTQIANLSCNKANDVFLFSCGMSAIFSAFRLALNLSNQSAILPTVQFGFPYTDTLKIQEKLQAVIHPNNSNPTSSQFFQGFFPQALAEDYASLEDLLNNTKISALFCEFPSNPLLQSINLKRLRALADKFGFPIIIDDTLSSFTNLDLRDYADITATSLTKFFSGASDCMAGSLILNPKSQFYKNFATSLKALESENPLFGLDLLVLENNSQDFELRMQRINQNTEKLCDFLKNHPLVDQLYYPKFINSANYEFLQKQSLHTGFGGVFSLVLKNPETNSSQFFDALAISKGPSLGTNFTLACPYTLLAHYDELDFVERCGVSHYLIRVSVGLEEADDLIQRFSSALGKL